MPENPDRSLKVVGKRLFGLIGNPLTHSFSKKYFTQKFERENLSNCRYELFPIISIDELPGLLKSNSELEGINVTIPYKKQVLAFLDSKKGIPEQLNACNCISIKDGKLYGFNTDWIGFEKSIKSLLHPHHTKALVLGNGGATVAITYALKKMGIHYMIVSRTLHSDSMLTYKDLTKELMEAHTLIINTTPVGLYPNENECPDIPYQYLSANHLLYDLVYNPVKTLFLKKGEANGATIKNGEEMLKIQAEESWAIWNNISGD
jgi:shikimate dehydrogenase